LDDTETAYTWLLDHGVKPAHLVFAGDSAGANLAVSATLRLRDRGKALPAGVVAISPWFDLTCAGLETEHDEGRDALLSRPLLENMANAYLGGVGSLMDPLASPLHADLTGLPPVYLCAGGDEALADAARFTDRARHAGVAVTLDQAASQQHVYPIMAGRAPEADRTIADIAHWLAPRIGCPSGLDTAHR
jgi:acetyl esterase/lipase